MKKLALFASAVVLIMLGFSGVRAQDRPKFLKPPPPGGVELTGMPVEGGIVDLKDGTLALFHKGKPLGGKSEVLMLRTSRDGGKSWSQPQPLNLTLGDGDMGVIRLQSGALALYNGPRGAAKFFSLSVDDRKTWTPLTLIPTYQDFTLMYHSLIQLESGRLLLSGYWEGLSGNSPDTVRLTETGWGIWRGQVLFMEGERYVGMGICVTYYSDDEGKTWKQSDGAVIGWFDEKGEPNGLGGFVDLYEPTSAETKDGRRLLIARSKTGRWVASYSYDHGKIWYSARPMELVSSQSPALVIRLPKTGDLLCVWNQVSAEEVRRGFLRGRLSSAISRDGGMTWGNFKTLELQEEMADVDRVTPEFPIPRRLVGLSPFGRLPEGFAMFTYPNVDVVGDKIFVRYARQWPHLITPKQGQKKESNLPRMWPDYEERAAEMTGEGVLRVYPMDWFYQ